MKRHLPIPRRTPDRTVRDEMVILERLGFEYIGRNAGGHHLFAHPTYGSLRPMSSTPRNPMTWRRRHRSEVAARMGLNLFQLNRLIAGQPLERRERGPRRQRAMRPPLSLVVAATEQPADEAPIPLVRPDRTSCIDCGRRWLSDLDYVGRPCPACGGTVIGGKAA